jgi:hypothetical protein
MIFVILPSSRDFRFGSCVVWCKLLDALVSFLNDQVVHNLLENSEDTNLYIWAYNPVIVRKYWDVRKKYISVVQYGNSVKVQQLRPYVA